MKNKIVLIAFITQCVIYAQQTFRFQYDTAGNQVERYISYSGRYANSNAPTTETTTTLQEYDEFKYYPNPVKEELYLEWTNAEDKSVQEIQLFDLQGKVMYQKMTNDLKSTSIPFQPLAKGVYFLHIQYSNQTQKSIKILKD